MNPAGRLLEIYDTLVRQQQDQQMVNTWAEVLSLEKGPHIEDDVTTCLVALRQQIDFTRMRLDEIGVPTELTSPGFDRLKNIASPSQLNASWNSHRSDIQSPECRHAFTWSAWILRDDDEADMSPDELSSLHSEIDSLESSLATTEISPYLRDFIRRQVDTIRAALRVYGVQGARPLKDALQKVAGAYTLEGSRVETEYAKASDTEKGILARTGATIKKFAEVCDNIEKIKRFGEGAWSIATSVAPLVLPYINRIP